MNRNFTFRAPIYIIILAWAISLLSPTPTRAKYWEEVQNLPAGYALNYWLDVYFLPSDPRYGWICGFNGMTMRTTDGGATWSGNQIPGVDHLESIHFPTATVGYTSGPDGIYKSTNGGFSWFSVAPPNAFATWGCYFMNENDGVLLGGGCTIPQEFWRTTDGGSNWSVFQGTEPQSGLSDAIIYDPAGLGYASSSGEIWRTTDGGFTWDIFADTGDNYWQEEITNIGQSFLVPNSGQTCMGQGDNSGEIRFSTDDGASWRRFTTPAPMFGTFLTGTQSGWACGYDGFCYYTSDAGIKWTKRDCGLDERDLDDIWFITPDKGWVVGRGVWKLSPTKVTLHKNKIDYPFTCVNDDASDTLYLRAFNFDDTKCRWEITGPNAGDFEVPFVGKDFLIGSCLIKEFIILFKPKTSGDKQATLTLQCNYDVPGEEFTFTVPLAGTARRSTVYPETDLVVYNRAPVGRTLDTSITWRTPDVTYFEALSSFTVPSPVTGFSLQTQLPLDVRQNGAATVFRTIPQDTGWQEQRYTFHLYPCDRDTTITVRVYGVSPIINVADSNFTASECNYSRYDTLEFNNTGNDNLIITQAFISENPEIFSFVGFASGGNFPLVVQPGKSESIIIQFNPKAPDINYIGKLDILSNDATKGGSRRTVHVTLAGTLTETILEPSRTFVDFGKICVGDRVSEKIQIRNKGKLIATVVGATNKLSQFKFAFSPDVLPYKIVNGSQAEALIRFAADRVGVWMDTIKLTSKPCDEITEIIVRGEGISAKLASDKAVVSAIFDDAGVARDTVEIRAEGDTLTVTSISLPVPQGWAVTFNPKPPIKLIPGESRKIAIEITSPNPADYSSNLCFDAMGLCDDKLCLPANILKKLPSVAYNFAFTQFPDSYCSSTNAEDTVTVTNTGEETVEIVAFQLVNGSNFTLRNAPALPYTLAPGATLTGYVTLNPGASGVASDYFRITANDTKGSLLHDYMQELRANIFIPSVSVTESSIGFGELQTCDPPLSRSFTFVNSGNIQETITLAPLSSNLQRLGFSPTSLTLQPNESGSIVVSLDPAATGEIMLADSVYFTTSLCPVRIPGYVSGEVIIPKLQITPLDVNFGGVALGETATKPVTIKNISDYSLTLDSLILTPSGAAVLEGISWPVEIKPGETKEFFVKVQGDAIGNYTASLDYYYSSVCPYRAHSTILYSVFEEIFATTLKAGNYIVDASDTLDVAISSLTAAPGLDADSAYIELDFNVKLFHPISVRLARSPFTPLQMTRNDNGMSISVPRAEAAHLLDASGDVITIHGLALLNIPDSTALDLKRFDVLTRKNFTATLLDGSLELNPFCYFYGEVDYVMTEGFEFVVRGTTYDGSRLNLDSYSFANYSTDYVIYNSIGEAVDSGKLDVPKGINPLYLPLDSRLATGVYKLVLRNELNRSAPCIFILLK
ncbi:MAG: choice-of-anchor D domain-containing protein [Chloroflexota bacterium]